MIYCSLDGRQREIMILASFFLLFFVILLVINASRIQSWKKITLGLLAFLCLDLGLGWTFNSLLSAKPQAGAFALHEQMSPTALNPDYKDFDGVFGQHLNSFTRQTNDLEPVDTSYLLICCYGGSSTYCINLSQEASWPSQLERQLRDKGIAVEVHNHGIPGHAFIDNMHNRKIFNCASLGYRERLEIHYQGWNDFRMINPPNTIAVKEELQKWHAKTNRLMTGLDHIKPGSIAYNYYYMNLVDEKTAHRINFLERRTVFLSALLMKVHTLLHAPLIEKRIHAEALHQEEEVEPTEDLIMGQIHENIAKLKTAENKGLFIPQLMNFELIREKGRSYKYWIPGITEQRAADYCRELSRYCAEKLPAKSYLSSQEASWQREHFLDSGHFSAAGCRQFAEEVAEHLLAYQFVQ